MANQPISKKPIYNLNLVLQETGIKADTLRAWERRYHLPQPKRTEGGHRLFSDFDIETIKWLIARQEEGMRISQAVQLWREIESNEQDALLSTTIDPLMEHRAVITEQESANLVHIRNRWIQACLNFDESTADQLLTQSFAQFTMETVCVEILQFGLSEIGSLWYQGKASVQQEHFASELAIRRLQSLVTAAPQPIRKRTVLVGCPPDENHTFSALLVSLLLRYRGWDVIYLGANVPKARLKETIEKTRPDLVVMIAMRLATSATLLDTALFLREFDIPMAFGGRIFNILPDMPGRIPGYFLGEDLPGAISIIENLITAPMPPIELTFNPDKYSKIISHFIEMQQHIEIQTLNSLNERPGQHIPLEDIQDANHNLAQDIIAALSLGDISLIGSNLAWVEGLMTNYNIPGGALANYLSAYRDAVNTHMNESGLPIVDGLTSMIQTN
jgi:methanogenic corrinoid protein MtbC1